ncbi:MAG: TIGR02996 domain-containing protein [Planctomycetes bacterium]|nr:TIGR02996 domain-containing protein [Planctomycetota bacterium]
MSDRDALQAAICAEPDEDTPRLAFADYLDEFDDAPRAAFIRAQVELARTPPWEPFAVQVRWRRSDVRTGAGFVATLPRVDGFHVEWPKLPFRRGFGWALKVRTVGQWAEFVEPLFDREPVGRLVFGLGALDDWRRVAASDRVRHFRDLTLDSNPIEPLRALRDEPATAGVTDIRFQRASGAGMPEVLEDLFGAPLGRTVRGLHFHTGYESLSELVDALNTRGPLERLSFSNMGITREHVQRLFDGPVATGLTALRFRDEQLGGDGLFALADGIPEGLCDLELSRVGTSSGGLEALARCDRLANLRRLSLSRNPLTKPRSVRVLSLSRPLAGLRALDLSDCNIGDKGVRHVTQAKFWPSLVELDLQKNPISVAGVKYLLDAAVPRDLTALVLTGNTLGADARTELTKKYGAAVVFTAFEVPTW